LRPADHERLQQVPIVGDQIEGYMVRSTSDHLWSRVSRDAAARGFDFEMLGRALIALTKNGAPGVTAMEVLFVTSSKEDVKQLGDVALEVKAVGSEILKEAWKARGYDVDCDFDCASCHDEEVCDDIREVVVNVNRKKREEKAADKAAQQGS
jgi:CO dehydrogenase/acetyl-CoA synthase beta subunit